MEGIITDSPPGQRLPADEENEDSRTHPSNSRRRTKTGCLTCRRRRIKCGEERPTCSNCIKSRRECAGYNQRVVFKAPIHGPTSNIAAHSGTMPRTTPGASFTQRPLPQTTQSDTLPSILPRTQSQDASSALPPTQVQGFVNNNQSTFGQHQYVQATILQDHNLSMQASERDNGSWQMYQGVEVPNGHAGNNSSDNLSTPQDTPPTGDSENSQSYWAMPPSQPSNFTNPRPLLGDEMDEDDDNDPYDVSSDEDEQMGGVENTLAVRTRALQRRIAESNLHTVMALQATQERQDTRVRTYHSVIDNYGPNMLATYDPSFRDSPLSDPIAASIFSHFLNVVAPGISMYERHPANPSLLLQGQPVPKSQQHIWAYTLPVVALRNHALMHAMLALSSLHIAKLQGTPIWVSLKHYHHAIRKLAKNVGLPTRRRQLATVATTMLLGYYEVMSADHGKWCDHLLGSQQLLKQVDFAGMTKFVERQKKKAAREKAMSLTTFDDDFDLDAGGSEQAQADIDEGFVSLLMGKRIDYAEFGEIIEDVDKYKQEKAYTQRDLDLYETQRDLFWWFLKQDTIQSILSQNRLFLTYDRWSHCPPRAPIGRRDAVHGTFDHLILLLGRLSDFASRDLARKKRAMKAEGGQSHAARKPTVPQSSSVCATNPDQIGTACEAAGKPPPPTVCPVSGAILTPQAPILSQHPGPPPSQGPPPLTVCPITGAIIDPQVAFPNQQPGPPSGWKGPPPPGWTGGPPPNPGLAPNMAAGSHGVPPSLAQLPPFAGMLPTGERHLPRGFSPEAASPSSEEDVDGCPDGQYMAAEGEWKEIGQTFVVFEERLGPDFQPLGPEYVAPIGSPFGPALQYRGYNISLMWIMYYMGLIVWHRAHPSMPPSAMIAAAMTGHETGKYANIIGGIAAGITPDAKTIASVTLAAGSGLTDSVFALFVAGVQYQDPAQRQWVIQRMLDTERLTGWETASQVAKGLETAWTKAFEMGRGPPYERYVEPIPSTIWNRATQRMDRMYESIGETTRLTAHNTAVSGRAQWATGIIGIEHGISRVDINSDDENN